MKDKILAAYETMAASYHAKIDHKPHNAYYDRPNTLALLGNPEGLTILDAACGPGKYAEILIKQGAQVRGFDLSPKMVGYAQERNQNNATFYVQDFSKPLVKEKDSAYDVVLCALALHYLEDWQLTVQEFNRVLKKGGILVVSIEHPFFEYNYFQSEHYFRTEAVQCTWKGFDKPVEVHSYRRSLGSCIEPFTNNGFYVDQLVEPKPVKEFESLDPKHFKELNEFPAFLCIKAVKK